MFPYLIAAVLASVGYGTASVLEALAARKATGTKIYIHPLYLIGLGLDAVAWICSLVALQHLTLFTVQAIVASSLLVTIFLARKAFSTPMRSATWAAMGLMVAGLVLLALSTGAQRPSSTPASLELVLIGALVIIGGGVLVGHRWFSPMVLSVLAGLAASVAALAGRGLQLPVHWWMLIASPMIWVVVLSGALAMIGYTRALETGAVSAVTAVFTAVEVIIPGLIGMLVFGDAARPGWEVAKFVALALAIGAVLWLAGQPGAVPDSSAKYPVDSDSKQLGQ